jgi:hypothetical protein
MSKHSNIATSAMSIGIFSHPFGPHWGLFTQHEFGWNFKIIYVMCHTINDWHWLRGGESINKRFHIGIEPNKKLKKVEFQQELEHLN